MNIKTVIASTLLALGGLTALDAQASTSTTANFNVKITITSTCTINTTSATDVNFGNVASSQTNAAASGVINVTCTNRTPYTLALDNGQNFATGTRNMKITGGGTDLVAYQMFQDSAHTQPWGTGSSAYSSTGNGSAQALTMYGLVPSANQAAGDYSDVVTATVTY